MPGTDLTVADLLCGHHRSTRNETPCILAPNHDGEHRDTDGRTWFNYGPIQQYQITWMSGHVETIPAHQVTYPHRGMAMTRSILDMPAEGGAPRVQLHAEIDGHWRLMLSAREEDIRTMRNVTGGERL
ncbi:hypothetical protein [Micromonospora sp. NPDC049891]|uniref:hypothetical protein n=1 Tax=Micromonospora sp. NPDC049891 TaxID=3155655 RepID=UPI0033F67579